MTITTEPLTKSERKWLEIIASNPRGKVLGVEAVYHAATLDRLTRRDYVRGSIASGRYIATDQGRAALNQEA